MCLLSFMIEAALNVKPAFQTQHCLLQGAPVRPLMLGEPLEEPIRITFLDSFGNLAVFPEPQRHLISLEVTSKDDLGVEPLKGVVACYDKASKFSPARPTLGMRMGKWGGGGV